MGAVSIKVAPAAKEYLIEVGWDPQYGARPLKRAIQKHLEDELAKKILAGAFAPGERIAVTRGEGGLEFGKAMLN